MFTTKTKSNDIFQLPKITVDFMREMGFIKPMHGVGQPPFIGIDFSMCDYLKKAHIPYSRLHDVGGPFGGNLYVDIPNIFRDFSCDPEDPQSYDFAFTDLLIKELIEREIEPFFRLGVTIENYRKIKAYRINPPNDYEKWAKICEGIIRHYTEGWADGFHYKITYWEIWNEPDNFEDPEENQMWTGTPEDYYKLYEVASKHLKEIFPHLKIGGYASCGFYAITDSHTNVGACSPRYQYFIDFFDGFLAYIKSHNCPLDFFSWHSYADVEANIKWAEYARNKLNEAGYKDTEHTLNEWNWQPELKGTTKHATLTCAMLLSLQNTSLNSAMFYDAGCNTGIYAGLFDCATFKPLPTYYSFVAFGELYKHGKQVYVGELPEKVYACASKEKDGCFVIANTNEKDINITLDVNGISDITECKIIKNGVVWEDYEFKNILPAESVIYIKFDL